MIKEIKTDRFEGLAVLVPDDAYAFTNELASHQIDYIQDTEFNEGFLNMSSCILLKNYWNHPLQIIGKATELTEEQCAEIVDNEEDFDPDDMDLCGDDYEPNIIYKNYGRKRKNVREFTFNKATDSLLSLMQSLECYSVNPYGDRAFNSGAGKWQEAQANVCTWIILRKEANR